MKFPGYIILWKGCGARVCLRTFAHCSDRCRCLVYLVRQICGQGNVRHEYMRVTKTYKENGGWV